MYSSQSKNSKECLKNGLCDPIGGQSVWSIFGEFKKPLIISISTIDSNSIFHESAFGANSYISSVIANLVAADALKNEKENFLYDVIFAFFTGESWGYIGSKRFLHDIKNFKCEEFPKNFPNGERGCSKPYIYSLDFKKINLENIKYVIELGQIANKKGIKQLFIIMKKVIMNYLFILKMNL